MKKIFDWTVGSFFRTIGRTIAFFVMATLVYYLLSYNDIDFGIKNLFFDNVKADSFTSVWVPSSTWREAGTSTWNNTLNRGDSYHTFNFTISNGAKNYFMKFDSQDNVTGYSELEVNIKLLPLKQDTISYSSNISTTCTTQGSINSSGYQVINSLSCTGSEPGQADINKVNWGITLSYFYNNNVDLRVPCYVKSNSGTTYSFVCPLTTNNIDGFIIGASTTNLNVQFEAGFYYIYTLRKDGSQSIIDNQNQNSQQIINATQQQTQQQQQQHQETMNSSTTDAENDATSFFGNFTVEDQGGLSAIVTAPLNTIRSLLSSTCADLVLPLPFVEEDLTLPCMYSIYTQHFGAFFSLYQTIILGIIAYRCIMSIFFDIKGFTNPNDDRIEVMDL